MEDIEINNNELPNFVFDLNLILYLNYFAFSVFSFLHLKLFLQMSNRNFACDDTSYYMYIQYFINNYEKVVELCKLCTIITSNFYDFIHLQNLIIQVEIILL